MVQKTSETANVQDCECGRESGCATGHGRGADAGSSSGSTNLSICGTRSSQKSHALAALAFRTLPWVGLTVQAAVPGEGAEAAANPAASAAGAWIRRWREAVGQGCGCAACWRRRRRVRRRRSGTAHRPDAPSRAQRVSVQREH